MNKAERIFTESALERGGIYLYSRENVIAFVLACKEEKICLLGIDGFWLTAHSIQPSMEDSIDFSSSFFTGDCYEKAIGFLAIRSGELFFEVVIDDQR